MSKLVNHRRNDDAVSPVIGVMLMMYDVKVFDWIAEMLLYPPTVTLPRPAQMVTSGLEVHGTIRENH